MVPGLFVQDVPGDPGLQPGPAAADDLRELARLQWRHERCVAFLIVAVPQGSFSQKVK